MTAQTSEWTWEHAPTDWHEKSGSLTHKEALKIEYSPDNTNWSMLRLAYFPPNVPVKIGLMAAAPGKLDFSVTFDYFTVSPLTDMSDL